MKTEHVKLRDFSDNYLNSKITFLVSGVLEILMGVTTFDKLDCFKNKNYKLLETK